MSFFLLATIVTFLIVQIVLRSQVTQQQGLAQWLLGPTLMAALNWRLVVVLTSLGVAVFAVVVFTLVMAIADPNRSPILWQLAFSPQIAAAWFGALVGWLFAVLYNRIAQTAVPELTARDRLEFVVVLLLVFLGVFGEETLLRLVNRVTAIKYAGAEITLADGKSSSQGQPGLSASVPKAPSASAGNAEFAPGEPATGLAILAALDTFVDRDQTYVRMFDPAIAKADIAAKFRGSSLFASKLVSPIARCLSNYAQYTGDTGFVRSALVKLLEPVRHVVLLHPEVNIDEAIAGAADTLLQEQTAIAGMIWSTRAIYRPHLDEDGSCRKMLAELCDLPAYGFASPAAVKVWNGKALRAIWQRRGCERLGLNRASSVDVYRRSAHKRIVALLRSARDARRQLSPADERPYFTLLYAALMAQLEKYPAALLALDRWIADPAKRDEKTADQKWTKVRSLSTLAALAEEWIRGQRDNVPLALRDYHLNNLIELDRRLLDLPGLPGKTGGYVMLLAKAAENGADPETATFRMLPQAFAECANIERMGETEHERKDRRAYERRLLRVFLANRMSIAHHMLEHPEYASRYISQSAAILGSVYGVDLRCAMPNASSQELPVMQAELLELVARGLLKEARAIAPIRQRQDTEQRVWRALDAVRLGLETIAARQQADRDEKRTPARSEDKLYSIGAVFGSTPAIEAYTTLLRARTGIQAALADPPG